MKSKCLPNVSSSCFAPKFWISNHFPTTFTIPSFTVPIASGLATIQRQKWPIFVRKPQHKRALPHGPAAGKSQRGHRGRGSFEIVHLPDLARLDVEAVHRFTSWPWKLFDRWVPSAKVVRRALTWGLEGRPHSYSAHANSGYPVISSQGKQRNKNAEMMCEELEQRVRQANSTLVLEQSVLKQ